MEIDEGPRQSSMMTTAPVEHADALVLFGATGDLARKKLFSAIYHMAEAGSLDMPVVGIARSGWDSQRFRAHVEVAIGETVQDLDPVVVEALLARTHLVGGDYSDELTFAHLRAELAGLGSVRPAFYLAIPPGLFPTVIEGLSREGLNKGSRIIVEKPFGRSLVTAVELNQLLRQHFAERDIFRIDHYLGKEAVEDLLVFRFANTFLEPIWNRNYVKSVQITMAEQIGVEGRGAFYEGVGALRDVVQNHMLQVVAMLAMEPPVSPHADALRDEKVKVFQAMRSLDAASVVRGQYEGYSGRARSRRGLHGGDLRRLPFRDRFVALVRRPVLRTRWQGHGPARARGAHRAARATPHALRGSGHATAPSQPDPVPPGCDRRGHDDCAGQAARARPDRPADRPVGRFRCVPGQAPGGL